MSSSNARVKRHRQKLAGELRRVEVSVKGPDVELIRRAASMLRQDGEEARDLREVLGKGLERQSALQLFEKARALWPGGPMFDIGRDDLAPDRDIDL
jgi:hypothetical protein